MRGSRLIPCTKSVLRMPPLQEGGCILLTLKEASVAWVPHSLAGRGQRRFPGGSRIDWAKEGWPMYTSNVGDMGAQRWPVWTAGSAEAWGSSLL